MKRPIIRFLAILVLAPVLTACGSQRNGPEDLPGTPGGDTNGNDSPVDSPYSFDAPNVRVELHEDLLEISGLAVLGDGRLAAVQDEDGVVFILEPETGNIAERIEFGDGGDYEGIELAGESLFVLRSNGNLIELTGWRQGSVEARALKTELKGKNDLEGLAFDPAHNRLLMVTKEEPGGDLDEDRYKAIYAVDLASGSLNPDPVATLDLDQIAERLPDLDDFKPSALAVHPSDGALYVLSSSPRALAILDPDGGIRGVWKLPAGLFEQPEGLAFSPDGDLFISSEGVDGPGVLARFAPSR